MSNICWLPLYTTEKTHHYMFQCSFSCFAVQSLNEMELVFLWVQVRDLSLAYLLVGLTYLYVGVMVFASFPSPPLSKDCIEPVSLISIHSIQFDLYSTCSNGHCHKSTTQKYINSGFIYIKTLHIHTHTLDFHGFTLLRFFKQSIFLKS